MKKKGFTLVELLAVIAILAILVIIALPNVLGMFNQAKKNTFVTELQSIYSTAETQFVSDSMGDMTKYTDGIYYGRVKGQSMSVDGKGFKILDLSGTTSIDYMIHFNLAGKVTEFYATDGQFQFIFANGNGLAKQEITATTIKSNKDVVCGDSTLQGANQTDSSKTCYVKPTTFTIGNNDNNVLPTGVITLADAESYIDGTFTRIEFSAANALPTHAVDGSTSGN